LSAVYLLLCSDHLDGVANELQRRDDRRRLVFEGMQ